MQASVDRYQHSYKVSANFSVSLLSEGVAKG